MLSDFDELDLLALIEGDLSAEKAAALRARLAQTPEALERIEAMIADRAELRVEPEPAMPRDFLADMEAELARPMLMQAFADEPEVDAMVLSPASQRMGEFRRQHRRPVIRRRIMRVALAASVALAAGAGMWLALRSDFVRLPTMQWALTEAAPPAESGHAPRDLSDAPPAVAQRDLGEAARSDSQPPAPDRGEQRSGDKPTPPAEPIPARVLLVIHSPQPSEAERLAERIVATRSGAAALVQNFSYEEAKQIEARWLLAQGAQREFDRERIVAGAGRMSDLARNVMQDSASRITLPGRDASQPFIGSRQLVGPRDLAASLVQQLEYSSRGATHTITVRAGDLEALLADLHAADAQAMFRPLPGEPFDQPRSRRRSASRPTSPSPELLWAQTLPMLRELLAELERNGDDAMLLLPMSIEPQPGR